MAEQAVSAEEFKAAGGDPAKMPSLGGTAPGDEESATSGNMTDIRPEWWLAGHKARPISAGVSAVLEEIDHPLYRDTPEGEPAAELKTVDYIILLYILFWPDPAELVEQAESGTLKKAAMVWSFELDPDELATAQEQAQGWLAETSEAVEALGGDTSEAKKNIG